MSLMMIEYEGRMMSTEEVLRLKNSTKEVIETPLETIKEEVETKEVIETPIIETPLVVKEELVSEVDELELAKQEYFKIFGKKPNPNIGLNTLKEKISQANI